MPSLAGLVSSDSHPLVASQLPSWYPHHSEHALKSVIIPLPSGFLQYLQEDGVFLPDDTAAVPRLAELDAALLTDGDYRRDDWGVVANPAAAAGVATGAASNVAADAAVGPQPSPSGPLHSGRDGLLSGSPRSSHGADGDSDSDSGSEAPDPRSLDWATRFPQLRAALESAISSLGGRVVPKLNWSCPSDALWISPGGSLACRNAEQVVLLLKSSDRVVAHDAALLAAAAAAADAAAATAATVATGESDVGEAEGPAAGEAAAAALSADLSRTPAQVASTSAESCGDHPQQPPQQQRGPQQQSEDQQEQQQGNAWGQEEGWPRGRGDRGGAPGAGAGPGPGSSSAGGGRSGGGALRQLKPVLVLKKWYNLRPEREFRCFVRGGALVAASQRDVSQTFPALTPGAVAEVQRRLWRFWRDKLRGSLPLADFAFDVYVPSDADAAVRLVDVNPLTDTTAPLLYEWEELGFGPAAVQPAEALLQRLLHSTTTSGVAAVACSGGGVEESWMDEAAAEGPAALPLPSCAEELLVRTVQDTSRGPRAAAAAGSGPDGDGGDGGLAGLMGPMLLGSRAALAMPYDMLGIADSVDKLIEAMQAQHAEHKRRRRHQHGGRGGGGSAQTGSDSDDNDDDDDDSAYGGSSHGEYAEGCVAGAASSVAGAAVRGQRPASGAAAGAREGAGGREGGDDACNDVGVGPSAAELAAVFGGEEGGCVDLDLAEETGLVGGADTDTELAAQAVAMKGILSGGSEGL